MFTASCLYLVYFCCYNLPYINNYLFTVASKVQMDTTLFRELFTAGDEVINLVQGAPGIKHLVLANDLMKSATDNLLVRSSL